MLFLAHILNRPVYDAAGLRLGWVEDLLLNGLDLFPRINAIVLARRGRGAVFVPWSAVGKIGQNAVDLNVNRELLPASPLPETSIFLRRDILDKQIVDIHGRRVVRVNDLQLAPVDNELRLVGADIGVSGLLRRLNLERPARVFARSVNSDLPERVIPWNYVEGLETEWPSLRLNVSHRRLRELPPTDIADILTQLPPEDRDELLQHIDDETVADVLPHLEEDIQADAIMAMTTERASDIIERLPPDEAADVLGDLSELDAERILHLMEPDEAEDVRELLRYADDTAGGRMTTEFLAFTDDQMAEDVLASLRTQAPDAETVYYVYVTDAAGRLDGVLSLRDLITAAGDTPLSALAQRDVVKVSVDDDQETVAHVLTRYHLLAVPVIDADGVLRGIVTADDVLDVLHEEAEEDISRLAGSVEESDVLATSWEQAALRLPWLLAAILAGMAMTVYLSPRLISVSVGKSVLLAVLPLMMLLGVQIGGQAAALTQVALADGIPLAGILREHLRRQWPVGASLGLVAALISGGLIRLLLGGVSIFAVIGVIWLVLLVDLLAGSLLPVLLHRLRWDPLLVSRPALALLALLLGVPLLAQVL